MTKKIQSINPYNNELLKEFDYFTDDELEQKISKAQQAFWIWKKTSYEEKVKLFKKLYEIMMAQKEELAKLNTLEMWMLYSDALWDITKSSSNILFFADNAKDYLASKEINEHWVKARIVYEPMGIIFSIMPWNYPFNQVLRSVIPNLIAWNVVLLKHASNVPQVAVKLEELFKEAWFPEWVYTNLFITHDKTEKIIADFRIKWTNVTGSDVVWREVWKLSWMYIKPSIIELGWNDAFIVWNVKNVDSVVSKAVKARFSNNWQKCNSSKRFIVLEAVYDEFLSKFKTQVEALKIWDPMDTTTNIWPLAKKSAVDTIEKQVSETISAWAELVTGWERISWAWAFYKPTILAWIKSWMKTFEEETFGPVASVIKASDIYDAVKLANDSVYGLWASIFTDDETELNYVLENVEVWNIAINNWVTSYANLPYWGIKNSWYGKELWEKWVKAFVNEKVIVM